MSLANDKVHFTKIRSTFFFALVLLLTAAFAYLLHPFFYPLFWAAVLAVMFFPFYKWLNRHLKFPRVSAMLTVIFVTVLVFVPLLLLGLLIVEQTVSLYAQVSPQPIISNVTDFTKWLAQTRIGSLIRAAEPQWIEYFTHASKTIGGWLIANITEITQNSLRFLLLTFITLYCLYYFLKDGLRMIHRLTYLSPLGDEYEYILLDRFTSTARATLKSTIMIGAIQGFIGSILFSVTNVSGAIIWGVIMAIAAIFPAVGAWIVWLPLGLLSLFMGKTWEGITIIAVGAFLISLIDNVLRPWLVGKDIAMHPLLVFISTLGGIVIFGISGFVIGPIITALFLSMMSMYDYYYEKELKHN